MDAQPNGIEQVFRTHYGRAVAVLTGAFGDIHSAEEAVQEAFTLAVQRWAERGIPPSPDAWIITTAKNRAIDRLRREAIRPAREAAASVAEPPAFAADAEDDGAVRDDHLRLIFMCAHPALAQPAQVALTLRLLGGLSTSDIASAFLVPEPTIAQRIVRAKRKIKSARIPFRIPAERELSGRLAAVLSIIYLIFNEGWKANTGAVLVRQDLSAEAIRLGRTVHELLPEPEVAGLLALMLLLDARRAARVSEQGDLVILDEQDRSRWDHEQCEEGRRLVRDCLLRNEPGQYQILAAINAVHSDALAAADTDWSQILELYDQLMGVAPTPVVALNRAVALAEVHGPAAALSTVDRITLDEYYPYHAVRADLLRRLGRTEDAAAAYGRAVRLTANDVERAFLMRRRNELT